MTSRSPIVVAGMHRSGTSMVASMLAAAGVDMGGRLLPGDTGNPRGYFEDLDFLDLNRRLLMAATPASALGHQDYGWTTAETLDRERFREDRQNALNLIARRRSSASRWGWKDPRTALLLDFWQDLLIESGCDPVYLLLYRFPWDVADSMQRRGFDLLLRHPEYAFPIWSFYNRHLLDFHARNRERCLLISINALWEDPEKFSALLETKWGIELSRPIERMRDAELWNSRSGTDPLISLVASTSGSCTNLLSELDRQADLSSAGLWSAQNQLQPRLRRDGSADRPVDLSVIVPCYNDGEFLPEAIASVERAVPATTELIVVNDGSTEPRTLEILRILSDAGYRILSQPNSGVAAAKNLGIAAAKGRYVLPLHADDRLAHGFADAAQAILDTDSSMGVVYGDRWEFGLNRGRVRVPDLGKAFEELDAHLHGGTLSDGNYAGRSHSSTCAMFRKSIWETCGGYDPGLRTGEEWDLWIAASQRGCRFRHLDTIAFERRVRPESLSEEHRWPEVARRWRARVTARVLERHRIAKGH